MSGQGLPIEGARGPRRVAEAHDGGAPAGSRLMTRRNSYRNPAWGPVAILPSKGAVKVRDEYACADSGPPSGPAHPSATMLGAGCMLPQHDALSVDGVDLFQRQARMAAPFCRPDWRRLGFLRSLATGMLHRSPEGEPVSSGCSRVVSWDRTDDAGSTRRGRHLSDYEPAAMASASHHGGSEAGDASGCTTFVSLRTQSEERGKSMTDPSRRFLLGRVQPASMADVLARRADSS